MEVIEHPANIRMVVDADHDLTFATPHDVSHPLIILKRKVHTVTGGLPVRRIHVMETMATVVALSAFQPRQIST